MESNVNDGADFQTIKLLFPHVPDATITDHLCLFTSGDRLTLISNLLLDYREESYDALQTGGSEFDINQDAYDTPVMLNLNNYDMDNFSQRNTESINTAGKSSSTNQQCNSDSFSPILLSSQCTPTTCSSSVWNSSSSPILLSSQCTPTTCSSSVWNSSSSPVLLSSQCTPTTCSSSVWNSSSSPILLSSQCTPTTCSSSVWNRIDKALSSPNLTTMQNHNSISPSDTSRQTILTSSSSLNLHNTNRSITNCHSQNNSSVSIPSSSRVREEGEHNIKRTYSVDSLIQNSKLDSTYVYTENTTNSHILQDKPTFSTLLSPSSPKRPRMVINGYGFCYRKQSPKPTSKPTSPNCSSASRSNSNCISVENDLPKVLSLKRTSPVQKPPKNWEEKAVCKEEFLNRFPSRLGFLELIEASDLSKFIQDTENTMFSPSYDTSIRDDDHWRYKWYWRAQTCFSNVGKCFDKWSQDKLEQMYHIHQDNFETVKILLRKDKKLEAFQVHFWSMSMSRDKEKWFITRLKTKKIDVSPTNNLEVECNYPLLWQPQKMDSQLLPVKKGSSEWNEVNRLFQKTLRRQSQSVLNIQRVQNKWLWKKYYIQKKLMIEKNGIDNVNEKRLFHGTRGNDPSLIWKGEEGFDSRFCTNGMWGVGSYFAECSAYSVDYAHQLQNGNRQLFLANVLTGYNKEMLSDESLKLPPVRNNSNGIPVRYNSVSGISNGLKIYVVYQLDFAYPSYLLTLGK